MTDNLKNLKFVISCAVSSFKESHKSFEDIIKICMEGGYAGIEGNCEVFSDLSISELTKIGKLFKDAGVSIQTFHLPYADPLLDDIATLYETDRLKVESKMKEWIEKSVALGSSIGIVHPTTKKNYNADIEGLERICGQADKTIQSMLKFGEQFNYKIALENMLPYRGGRLGCKNEHMLRLYENNKHPNLGFCLDTGHSLVAHGINAMKEHLIAFHLADNGGDRDSHLQPGKGNYFWKEFFNELNKMDFRNNVCIEAPPFTFGPDYPIESWKKMLAEVKELINKNLV